MKRLGIVGSAIAALLFLGATSAEATPVTLWFDGSLTDGATASGDITINVSGYLGSPTSITSTSGLFSGYTYSVPPDPSNLNNPLDNVLVLSSPNYNRYLYLDFSQSLALGGTDDLIAASSFECNGYGTTTDACTANAENVRYFSTGTAVPEPMTLSMFGAGLIGLFMLGRRERSKRPAQAAV